MLRNAIVRASLRDAIERLPRLPLGGLSRLPLDNLSRLPLDNLSRLPPDDLSRLGPYKFLRPPPDDLPRLGPYDFSRPPLDDYSRPPPDDSNYVLLCVEPPPLICWPDYTVLQEDLSSSEDREIRAINWPDRCSLKWRLYNSEHPDGGCRVSEPSMLLSIAGVQPRKLRVKDWQNAHGKVGIVGCLFHLGLKERTKAPFPALPPLFVKTDEWPLGELELSSDTT